MKLRTTLVMLLILLVAAGGLWLVKKPETPPPARLPLVAEELLAEWEEIDLDLVSDQKCRLVREPGAIMIEFGMKDGKYRAYRDYADLERVAQLLQRLRGSWREPLQSRPEDFMRAGLEPPRLHVAVRGGGKEEVLGFGNPDPNGHGILARSLTDGTMFRTSKEVPNQLEYNLREWRSRTVFGVDALEISQMDVIKYDDEGKGDVALSVVREGPRTWRIAQPKSLMAEPSACHALATKITALRITYFAGEELNEVLRKASGLPDRPRWGLQVSAGQAVFDLEIGRMPEGQGYACRMALRDPDMVFTIEPALLDPILQTTVDSLRPRRLFPPVETTLVGLECRVANGAGWKVERENQHPRGNWWIREPFQGRANEGKGANSIGQVIVDVDRTEVVEFLPADAPFEPKGTLVLHWRADAVLQSKTLELAVDGARTLVRDPERPGERFAVPAKLGSVLGLDLELFRDRTIFPDEKDFTPRLVHWKLVAPGRSEGAGARTLELRKGAQRVEPVGDTRDDEVASLQSAPSELIGGRCAGYVRAATVLAAPGAKDPFATVAFELTLGTAEGGDETLIVSGAAPDAQSPDGVYCKLVPRLPDDVWMIVPGLLLEPVQRLLQE